MNQQLFTTRFSGDSIYLLLNKGFSILMYKLKSCQDNCSSCYPNCDTCTRKECLTCLKGYFY